jgi:hypothetical protein
MLIPIPARLAAYFAIALPLLKILSILSPTSTNVQLENCFVLIPVSTKNYKRILHGKESFGSRCGIRWTYHSTSFGCKGL